MVTTTIIVADQSPTLSQSDKTYVTFFGHTFEIKCEEDDHKQIITTFAENVEFKEIQDMVNSNDDLKQTLVDNDCPFP